MERVNRQPTFTDAVVADLGSPRANAFFEVCDREIPWAELAASVADVFAAADDDPAAAAAAAAAAGGRPHWPVVTMLKITLLQRWFALSDPMAEEMLRDRISFRRFVGLSFDDATPDHSTICVFRRRLRERGHGSTLFDRAVAALRARGLVVDGGTLVDATIIEAPRGGRRADGSGTADPCATATAKHGRGYFGYRAHVATDRNGIVTDFVYDTAAESEHTHFDHLARGEARAVYADSGCRSRARVAALEARGVAAHLCHRRVRGQAALTAGQRAFNRAVSKVRAFVEHPFAWIKRMSGARARYRGCARNAVDFALAAVAYNFRRSFSIKPAAAPAAAAAAGG
jgi:IS5 family transposase